MTFVVGLAIRGDASDAQAALKAATADVQKLGSAAETAGRKVGGAGAAQRKAAGDAEALARSNRMAAGSVGNLAAQFNDIGVMLAAGQSPLQLALQQGTQISQTLGPMGAAGAVKALGAGLLSMISPVSLLTIGAIAAGAAFFQWLTSAGEEALSLEDQVKALAEQTDSYAEAAERANSSTADLSKQYGSAADAARIYLRELAEVERREAERAARAAVGAVRSEVAGADFWSGERQKLVELFDQDTFAYGTRRVVGPVMQAFDQVDAAQGIDEQVAALEELKRAFGIAADASGSYSAAEDAALRQIHQLLLEQQRLRASIADDSRQRTNANGRFPTAEGRENQNIADQMRVREATQDAARQIAALRQQADLQNLIARFGEDSFQVAQARQSAERAVLAEMVAQLNVAPLVKAELLAAWDAANGIQSANIAQSIAAALGASTNLQLDLAAAWDSALGVAGTDMVGPISAAAGGAVSLAGNFAVAAANALQVAENAARAAYALNVMNQNNAASAKTYGGRGGDPRDFMPGGEKAGTGNRFIYTGPALDVFNNPVVKVGTGSAGGSARAETDAVQDLIAKLQEELDLLREADPVRQELLRHREALAGATSEERAAVEGLQAAILAETSATEALKFAAESAGDALIDALMGGKNAGEQLLQTLIKAGLQATLLGTGPLAGLFGGGGGAGGLLSGLFAPAVKKAGGGMVYGMGGPTDDRVPSMLSNGEFVVRAAAAQRHRHILEAMNGGGLPGYAAGGFVGGGSAPGAGGGRGAGPSIEGTLHVALDEGLTARFESKSRDIAVAITGQALRTYDREVLPARVGQVGRDGGRTRG